MTLTARAAALWLSLLLSFGCGDSTTMESDAGLDAAIDAGLDASAVDGGGDPGSDAGSDAGDPGAFDGGQVVADLDGLVEDGTWQWFNLGLRCRDGSTTGVGVRAQPGATRLVIYLEGGGACFNQITCAGNPANYAGPFASEAGIFSTAAENPLGDATFIYVPYCTGDVHAGTTEGVTLTAVSGTQDFVGRRNIETVADVATRYFSEAGSSISRVLLTGSSAGGFGAAISYPVIADAFAPTVVDLVADASPVVADDAVLAPCLQQLWRDLWGIELPSGCSDCSESNGDGLENASPYYASAYPDARFGLISRTGDAVIRTFYSFGTGECLADGFGLISADAYEAALLDYRDQHLVGTGRWSTYFSSGTAHTFFTGSDYTTVLVEDTTPQSWLADLLDGTVSQVGP